MPNLKSKISKLNPAARISKNIYCDKQWVVAKRAQENLVEQLLVNRGVDPTTKDNYLRPNFEKDLYNPNLLKNVGRALSRIKVARENNEVIGIFGDYDTDGVTSTVLLQDALNKIGLRVEVFIPSRAEGYGLNQKGIDYLISRRAGLIISVDLGITAKKEVEYALKNGADVIVIDHHLTQTKLLPNCIIINPKQKGDKYPNKDLSAGALVYKFNCALQNMFPELISNNDLKWWLDLAAISLVADMCPLTGENRVLVHFGLIVIRRTRRLGLKKLIEAASLKPEKITAGSVGFQIGPRLNAAGRIDHATVTYKLLKSDSDLQATKLAKEVNQINSNRQEDMEAALGQARAMVIQNKLYRAKIIMVAKNGWAPGIVGLVAGRLMEEFSRSSIVLYQEGDLYKGSARSVEKLHLLETFQSVAGLLVSFGGHAKAGGLAFKKNNFAKVYRKLVNYADNKLSSADLAKKIYIDAEIEPNELNTRLVRQLSKFEPFGIGNRKPLFVLRHQVVKEVKVIGKDGNHLKITLAQFGGVIFNFDANNQPRKGETIDIIFTPELSEWQEREKVDLIIEDWQYAKL